MNNRKILLDYVEKEYGRVDLLNYDEGKKHSYLRFIVNSTMYIATKAAYGDLITVYKMDRSNTNEG